MAVKKTIAIIGATGKMGSAITWAMVDNNYELLLMGRDQEKIKSLVDHLRNEFPSSSIYSKSCSKEACWAADVIILAIPVEELPEVSLKIKDVVTQKIIVSVSPQMPLEQLHKLFPHSQIIKAFYSNTPGELNSAKTGHEIDSLVSGDDEEALITVSEILKQVGLKPIVQHLKFPNLQNSGHLL